MKEDGVITYYQVKNINCRIKKECFIFEIDLYKSLEPITDTELITVRKTQEVIYYDFKDRAFYNHYYSTIFDRHLNSMIDKNYRDALQEMMKECLLLRGYIESLPHYYHDHTMEGSKSNMQEIKKLVYNNLLSKENIKKDYLLWKNDNELIYIVTNDSKTNIKGYIVYNFNKDKFSYVNFTGNNHEFKDTVFHRMIRLIVDKETISSSHLQYKLSKMLLGSEVSQSILNQRFLIENELGKFYLYVDGTIETEIYNRLKLMKVTTIFIKLEDFYLKEIKDKKVVWKC